MTGCRVGKRRSQIHRGRKEIDTVAVGVSTFDLKISETSSFKQKSTVITGDDGTEYKFDTSIKTKILDNVGLKFTHFLTHDTEAPRGSSDTKSITSVNLVFNF